MSLNPATSRIAPSSTPPMPAPTPWASMTVDQVQGQVDKLDSAMTKLEDEMVSSQSDLASVRHKGAIVRNVGIGSYIAMFGGIILGTAASLMASPLIIGVVVAGNVLGAASLIINARLDGKERGIHREIDEKCHQQRILQTRKEFAEEKLDEKLKAEEKRQQSVKEDFSALVEGVEDGCSADVSLNEDDLWLEVDGIRLNKRT